MILRKLKSPRLLIFLLILLILSFTSRLVIVHFFSVKLLAENDKKLIRPVESSNNSTSTNALVLRDDNILKPTPHIDNGLTNEIIVHKEKVTSNNILHKLDDQVRKGKDDAYTTCNDLMNSYGIVPGVYWGQLKDEILRNQWQTMKCNDVLNKGNIKSSENIFLLKPSIYETELINSNGKSVNALNICNELVQSYQVIPEVSWGRMMGMINNELRNKWQSLECNTILKKGGSVTCGELHGRQFVDTWKSSLISTCGDQPDLGNTHYCRVSVRDSIQCVFSKFKIDFGKSAPAYDYRALHEVVTRYFKHKRDKANMTSISLLNSSSDMPLVLKTVYNPRDVVKVLSSSVVDYKRRDLPSAKSFASGFLSSTCLTPPSMDIDQIFAKFDSFFPSFVFSKSNTLGSNCDVNIYKPVLLVSHDCMNNFGHLIQDLMNWWLVGELNDISLKDLTIVNIDGLRPGNILSGKGRHILDRLNIDGFGPFREVFEVLFGGVVEGASTWGPKIHKGQGFEESGKIVCFHDKVFSYPMPLKGFLWDKFEVEDPCSNQLQPSYIYRKFVTEYINSWILHGDLFKNKKSLQTNILAFVQSVYPQPTAVSAANGYFDASKTIRLLLITRKQVTSSTTQEILARTFVNIDELTSHIKSIIDGKKRVELIISDFADMSFPHQVALANSVDVLIGFHGAGINHMFHMNYTRPRCCGVIEIFPQSVGCQKHHGQVCSYSKRIGHGNHARFLGYKYITVQSPPNSLLATGTEVDVVAIGTAISQMIDILDSQRT